MWSLHIALFLLARSACAVQPGAATPPHSHVRPLVWGDLNVLHTTDTHGWHGGHDLEPSYSSDWGDYVSFSSHMHAKADEDGVDLLLVDTGDRVEGNGLYDGSSPKGKYTYDIVARQNIDIITTGNHELYKQKTSEAEFLKMVPRFQDSYISSNVYIHDPTSGELISLAPRRFHKFTTKNRGYRVLAFGFLFDFGGNYNNTVVTTVQDTVNQSWFRDALRDDSLDIIIVIGHVDIRSPEYETIYRAIRGAHANIPIQFFGGHSHIRDFKIFDQTSTAIESGRYMESIGWLSIDGLGLPRASLPKPHLRTRPLEFHRRYIDNNLHSLTIHSNTTAESFPTKKGLETSAMIENARHELGQDSVIGCVPQDYFLLRAPADSEKSILKWVQKMVLPWQLKQSSRSRAGKPAMALFNSGGIRFDLFKGAYTPDTTFSISPFESKFRYVADVPVEVVQKVVSLINQAGPVLAASRYSNAGPTDSNDLVSNLNRMAGGDVNRLLPPQQVGMMHPDRISRLFTNTASSKDKPTESQQFLGASLDGRSVGRESTAEEVVVPGYTTVDDAGDDGDDTVHSPLKFFEVPTVIMAEIGSVPEQAAGQVVDLVFIDFIEPFVRFGLQKVGYKPDQLAVEAYGDLSMGQCIESQVRLMWPSKRGKCV